MRPLKCQRHVINYYIFIRQNDIEKYTQIMCITCLFVNKRDIAVSSRNVIVMTTVPRKSDIFTGHSDQQHLQNDNYWSDKLKLCGTICIFFQLYPCKGEHSWVITYNQKMKCTIKLKKKLSMQLFSKKMNFTLVIRTSWQQIVLVRGHSDQLFRGVCANIVFKSIA